MPRKTNPLPDWIPQACELMAKYDISLRQAAEELGQDISIEEAAALQDRKPFKEALEKARLAKYVEIGSNPRLTREAVVARHYQLAEGLAAEGENFKQPAENLPVAESKPVN